MRLLIDGIIILDVLQKREPHDVDSSKIWKLCETDQAEGFVSALTLANLVYIMRKELNEEKTENVLKQLALIFRIADLTQADVMKAAEMQWNDFEDAVQAATAKRIGADIIVTRNIRDFRQSPVMAFTPKECLERLI